MEDTYLDSIPKEILDLILFELNVKDIISILGPDFYKDRVLLCRNIIKRDYGSYSDLKLLLKDININKVNWTKYDKFLSIYE